jgi:type IV secretion system protein VirB4
MLRLDKVIKPWKESAALNDHINLYGLERDSLPYQKWRSRHGSERSRRGL